MGLQLASTALGILGLLAAWEVLAEHLRQGRECARAHSRTARGRSAKAMARALRGDIIAEIKSPNGTRSTTSTGRWDITTVTVTPQSHDGTCDVHIAVNAATGT